MKAVKTPEEQAAIGILRDALVRLMRAEDLCSEAGYGMDVLNYVKNARNHAQKALDNALGIQQEG